MAPRSQSRPSGQVGSLGHLRRATLAAVVTVVLGGCSGSGSGPDATAAAGDAARVDAHPGDGAPAADAHAADAAPVDGGTSLSFPIRAAFYYPWFPEAWKQQGFDPFTNYTPSLGYYDGSDPKVLAAHLDALQYAHVQVGIASWWGQGEKTDQRVPLLLQAAAGTGFKWTLYYEGEGIGDPTPTAIRGDLTYIRDHYASDPSYLKIGGKFVVFVYADANDGCAMATRWAQANTVGAYVVLKVFSGYRKCADQPDSWHQYAPANAADSQAGYSYTISPGFWKKGEASPRLARDPTRWAQNISDMVASGAPWQLITTFNEWGEGTAVESAQEWSSSSGYGVYLDALHAAP